MATHTCEARAGYPELPRIRYRKVWTTACRDWAQTTSTYYRHAEQHFLCCGHLITQTGAQVICLFLRHRFTGRTDMSAFLGGSTIPRRTQDGTRTSALRSSCGAWLRL